MKSWFTVALGAAAMSFAGAASATTLDITSVSTIHGNQYSAKVNAPAVNFWPNSAPKVSTTALLSPQTIKGSLDGGAATTLKAFCIELSQTSKKGSFEVVTLSDYLAGKGKSGSYDTIAGLISTYGTTTNSPLVDAAVQLAVWEAFYETKSNFNVSTGAFTSSNWSDQTRKGGSEVRDLANQYLAGANDLTIDPSLSFYVAKNAKNQDLLFFEFGPPPAVPEPASWAMMIIGFGLVGGTLRRRAMRTAISFG
ncbi:MAG TPA: PEPxxWA-CTERM sorting domain-containing protein [Sphingobium sp.]|nr:PEPxxWA-CTERM sorting domain-containing protein [Sphingobium sp.]